MFFTVVRTVIRTLEQIDEEGCGPVFASLRFGLHGERDQDGVEPWPTVSKSTT